jgi:hypothetical protein
MALTQNPRRTPKGVRGGRSRINARTSWKGARSSGSLRLLHVQTKRNPRRCHAMTVSGLTMCRIEHQSRHDRESHVHGSRSTVVKRRRGHDRLTTGNWCRSARNSRCKARHRRDRTRNRIEWSRETTTDDTNGGYRRTAVTSFNAPSTVFSTTTTGGEVLDASAVPGKNARTQVGAGPKDQARTSAFGTH